MQQSTGLRKSEEKRSRIPGAGAHARRAANVVEFPKTQNGRRSPAIPLSPGAGQSRVNRTWNFLFATAMLAVTFPLMLVIAVAIKLTSRGPILFLQPRVGLNRRNGGRPDPSCKRHRDWGGKPFLIWKFRTMYVNSTRPGEETWASPDDPRVTPLGRILRKYRLDELPQLLNVLRGEMNVVGPRPEQPRIFTELRGQIEHYEERQVVLPGITGWAQVNHHYDRSIDDVRRKLGFDLDYVQRQSLSEDLRILLRTVPVVIFKRGAW